VPVFERPYLQSPGHQKPHATRYSGVCSFESLSVSRHHLTSGNCFPLFPQGRRPLLKFRFSGTLLECRLGGMLLKRSAPYVALLLFCPMTQE
jgi:hypothetical protein